MSTLVKFDKCSNNFSNLISASFDVAKSIAVYRKPSSDVDCITTTWLDCADNFFNDVDNNDKIV